jgi:hypothetical protein
MVRRTCTSANAQRTRRGRFKMDRVPLVQLGLVLALRAGQNIGNGPAIISYSLTGCRPQPRGKTCGTNHPASEEYYRLLDAFTCAACRRV